MRREQLIMGLAVAMTCLVGCGTSATIQRANAPEIEATIKSSDGSAIYVQPEGEPEQKEIPIPRKDIVDIDHPGNVAATIGSVLTAYGTANIIMGASDCGTQGLAYCMGVFLPASIGLGLVISGMNRWGTSTAAAETKPDIQTANVSFAPMLSLEKDKEVAGGSIRVTY